MKLFSDLFFRSQCLKRLQVASLFHLLPKSLLMHLFWIRLLLFCPRVQSISNKLIIVDGVIVASLESNSRLTLPLLWSTLPHHGCDTLAQDWTSWWLRATRASSLFCLSSLTLFTVSCRRDIGQCALALLVRDKLRVDSVDGFTFQYVKRTATRESWCSWSEAGST